MASHNLPLLHKYVFHNDDDLQLKMTKLQYRLCVQEVSNVILGKQAGIDYSEIEPSIEPDYSMATTVEAHPPMMEDFPSPTDEGLSSPDSEDYPRKPQNQDYIYNDSGILMDDSAMNSTLGGTTNGHLDDQLSDTSSMSDPSDYHINRQYFPTENDISCGYDAHRTEDDSAVYTNGDITEIEEDAIQVIDTRREARIPFENLPPPTDDDYVPVPDRVTPPESDRDSLSDSVTSATVHTPTAPPEDDLDEIHEEVILRSEVKRDELQERMLEEERDRERVDFVPGGACTDVDTALRILKTRYRLSCTTLKKCIITSMPPVDVRSKRYSAPVFSYDRSRWNLEDMIRGPNEQMPWWSKTREPESVPVEKDNRTTINDTIDRRQGEIADLLQKVLDEERRKQADREAVNKQAEPVVVAESPAVRAHEPQLEALPEPDDQQPPAPDQSEPGKKKKGNIFQRMIRAVRKRLSRNRHRA